jgi:hypothetical protein
MFELFSNMYFLVYKLYYVGQNDNLGIHVTLKNWDGGSSTYVKLNKSITRLALWLSVTTSINSTTMHLRRKLGQ